MIHVEVLRVTNDFGFEGKDAEIERVPQNLSDRTQRQRFLVSVPDQSDLGHLALNLGEGVVALREKFQNPFHVFEIHRMGLNCAELRLIHVSERGFCRKNSTANFLSIGGG